VPFVATDTGEAPDDAAEQALTDAGPRKSAGDARLCLATREVRPVASMLRFVPGPDGAVVPDLKRVLPGRGAWVTATRTALTEAIRRKQFARAFRGKAQVAEDLPDQVDRLLEQAALGALALANKAGAVISGFAKVENAIERRKITAVLHAADGGTDGVGKITGALRAAGYRPGDILVFRTFTSAQMDLALGRSNVVHACLVVGPAGDGFLACAERLARYRT
jgi:predicted RNA-binding protein YlxR (DUF448 family)